MTELPPLDIVLARERGKYLHDLFVRQELPRPPFLLEGMLDQRIDQLRVALTRLEKATKLVTKYSHQRGGSPELKAEADAFLEEA